MRASPYHTWHTGRQAGDEACHLAEDMRGLGAQRSLPESRLRCPLVVSDLLFSCTDLDLELLQSTNESIICEYH